MGIRSAPPWEYEMNKRFENDMIEATRLTRAGQLGEATALLQRLLGSASAPKATSTPGNTAQATGENDSIVIDATAESVEVRKRKPAPPGQQESGTAATAAQPATPSAERAASDLPGALRGMLERVKGFGLEPKVGGLSGPTSAPSPEVMPEGGRFIAGSYSNEAGSRSYKLYIPSVYHGQALPLIVMLHGCTQSPDDFAAGTRMNVLAEEYGCFVAYPAQSTSANASKCWNWFCPGDQLHGQGEPSLIAGITRQVMQDHAVDSQRVFVAGLSAGGAAAAIMATAYPDLYAAVGVHSGLACGAASDMPSAFAAMRQGGASGRPSGRNQRIIPTIVFHGDRDTTVHPRNGDQVIAQLALGSGLRQSVHHGQVPGGHAYSRTQYVAPGGQTVAEHWLVRGAGHAWSGGSPAGSYTDPQGPDAAREMLRFFLEHPRSEASRH